MIALPVALVAWEGAKWIYRKGKLYFDERRNEEKRNAEMAEAAIIQGVKEAEAAGLVDDADVIIDPIMEQHKEQEDQE